MSSIAAGLQATDLGSPHGITRGSGIVNSLWHVTYYIGTPLAAIVVGLIVWCLVRYRRRPGVERRPAQFQYHIPIEVAYTVIPLVLVAVVFGFVYGGENKITTLNRAPALKVTAEGFQWGFRFTYPNGHQEVGTYQSVSSINDETHLPTLYMPADETVQIKLVSDDVDHGFYIPAFLYQRDMIPGVNNVIDLNVTRTGRFLGECNQLCGTYHAFMRFAVDVMPPSAFNAWLSAQPAGSITNAETSSTGNLQPSK